MRSRVNRNQELYTQIANDTESKVESNDLSHFANRLNAIDEQFGKMDVNQRVDEPNHARSLKARLDKEVAQEQEASSVLQSVSHSIDAFEAQNSDDKVELPTRPMDEFDTFESTYLSDFLQEVKEYNVKQGYRDMDNTSTNIMKDLNLDIEINKSRVINDTSSASTPFIPEGIDALLTEIDPLLDETDNFTLDPISFDFEEEVQEDNGPLIDETQIFTAVDHMQRFDQKDAHLEETIALEVQKMVAMDAVESEAVVEVKEVSNDSTEYKLTPFGLQATSSAEVHSHPLNEVADTQSLEMIESVENDVNIDHHDHEIETSESVEHDESMNDVLSHEATKQLLEQTQTLQIKIIDQEKNIEEMSDTMVRTNRLLNVTLSLLMLAIFVVIMLIVSTIWGK